MKKLLILVALAGLGLSSIGCQPANSPPPTPPVKDTTPAPDTPPPPAPDTTTPPEGKAP
jgi:hypothetical protein